MEPIELTHPRPTKQSVSIVLLGSFTPLIYQPLWLAQHELIRQKEADEAEVKIIHPQVAEFHTPWFLLQATTGRLFLQTAEESFTEPLRDLVLAILQLTNYTPLKAMGVNLEAHYSMEDEKNWHNAGDRLAPKELWDPLLNKPGLRTMTMEGKRQDRFSGAIHVKVEPSTAIQFGIYVEVNDHFELGEDGKLSKDTSLAQEILTEEWQNLRARSNMIGTAVANIGKGS